MALNSAIMAGSRSTTPADTRRPARPDTSGSGSWISHWWAGAVKAGQGQQHATLHPATTTQHDDYVDGTPVVPGGDEHRIVLGVVNVLAARVRTRLRTVRLWPSRRLKRPVRDRHEISSCRFRGSKLPLPRWQPEPEQSGRYSQHASPVLQGIEVADRSAGLNPADLGLSEAQPLAKQGLRDTAGALLVPKECNGPPLPMIQRPQILSRLLLMDTPMLSLAYRMRIFP
jgi:hypothetical protein